MMKTVIEYKDGETYEEEGAFPSVDVEDSQFCLCDKDSAVLTLDVPFHRVRRVVFYHDLEPPKKEATRA